MGWVTCSPDETILAGTNVGTNERERGTNSWGNCCHFAIILFGNVVGLLYRCENITSTTVWDTITIHTATTFSFLKTYSVSCTGRMMRFWCRNTTPNGKKETSFHSRFLIHAYTAATQKHAHIHVLYTHGLDICLSPLIQPLSSHILWHWEIFVPLMMLLLLEISHPALFTDRCLGILDFALWIVNIWWSISKLGGAHIGL